MSNATIEDLKVIPFHVNENRLEGLYFSPPLRIVQARSAEEDAEDLRASKEAMSEGGVRPFTELLNELDAD